MAIEFNSIDDKMSYAKYIFYGITHRGNGYDNPIEDFIDYINKSRAKNNQKSPLQKNIFQFYYDFCILCFFESKQLRKPNTNIKV